MMQENTCYSTLVSKDYISKYFNRFKLVTENDDIDVKSNIIPIRKIKIDETKLTYFVDGKYKNGLLKDILLNCIKIRREMRDKVKFEKNEFMKSVLEQRQLTMKKSANAIYGFTCVEYNKSLLPGMDIAMTVTAMGREIISKTVSFVGNNYNCVVIYGDTDSIMVDYDIEVIIVVN